MKIAILSPFYPYRGGIAQFSALFYKALEKEHDVKAFSFSRLYPKLFFPGQTQYVKTEDKAIFISSKRLLDSINPLSYQKTSQNIEKFHPDILVITYWISFLALSYGYIARYLRNKTKIILLLHNAISHEPNFFDKSITRWLFNQSDGFIIMSEVVKNDLLTLKPHASYCLSPHPIYNHFGEKIKQNIARKALNLLPNKKTLLFFGLVRDYKGLDLLIDALSLLDESYQLIIAGEFYSSFEKYQLQINASNARNRIQVLNKYIGDKEVSLLFSATDILVIPYKSVTQSGVISIAYHFEIPIVATDVGNLREIIEKSDTGIICQAQANDLAHGIEKIYAIGTEKFIIPIRKEKKNLSWEIFIENLIKLSTNISHENSTTH
ncbi:glycosyltransferase [Candidatus Azobacteroides pseudotrichonymphae]|jgi:glycosyltransferase involved in cell wall biosynthesis|uniref:Glycosyltransferase n=1 Tax=Azobacteroides pseudotrichonymphae genomovar. CFP2 TaxID=511995 RepID=B6YRE3_AZOPC|nr:glycosyltransferase [Candidatus Azobacteroides pseudotrichonymphae]MDR0530232.1 glycosyltransferase [Bacteroidales bacterium OttesenSCG-928-I14]BAG83765.1 putative glycosyltransferase [Candidatus Azobacteroides pseudotrichonymphae genomovar. CFP2]